MGGVILIARPEFLFGSAAHDVSPVVSVGEDVVGLTQVVTPAQRLGAVGWVTHRSLLIRCSLKILYCIGWPSLECVVQQELVSGTVYRVFHC